MQRLSGHLRLFMNRSLTSSPGQLGLTTMKVLLRLTPEASTSVPCPTHRAPLPHTELLSTGLPHTPIQPYRFSLEINGFHVCALILPLLFHVCAPYLSSFFHVCDRYRAHFDHGRHLQRRNQHGPSLRLLCVSALLWDLLSQALIVLVQDFSAREHL